MSKKSRKRNKRLLALAGIITAGTLAAKNKRNASIQANEAKESGFADTGKKTDYITKKDTSKSDVKPIAKPESKATGSKVRTRQRIVDSSGNTVESAGVKSKDVKGILPPSQNKGNMYAGVGDTNPRRVNRKSGGRMGLKSGGSSVKKSMGKALRGGGKVIR